MNIVAKSVFSDPLPWPQVTDSWQMPDSKIHPIEHQIVFSGNVKLWQKDTRSLEMRLLFHHHLLGPPS